jgi:Protein of unknown function (DUF3226)
VGNTSNSNQLLVEGVDDLFSVVGLMKGYIEWPEEQRLWPVYIHWGNGAEEILKEGVLQTYLRGSTVKNFGVVLDADKKPKGRYESVRALCAPLFPNMPKSLPDEGMVVEDGNGHRLGVWIMPDNQMEGCAEDFLKQLVPPKSRHILEYAEQAVKQAISLGCVLEDNDVVKAELHTWLAWQDPPGLNAGMSLTKKTLDPSGAAGKPFAEWFKKLFQLTPRTTLPFPPNVAPNP